MSTLFHEMCRTCATQSNNLINIFDEREHGKTLAEKIFFCTQMLMKEQIDRPSRICDRCVIKLKGAYNFYNLVKNSENTFQRLYHSKRLPSDSDENEERADVPIEKIEIDQDDNFVDQSTTECDPDGNDIVIEKDKRNPVKVNAKVKKIQAPTQSKNSLCRKNIKANQNQIFECYKCKEKLSSFWKTHIHLKKHDAEEKFKCVVCGMRFVQWDEFNQHMCQGTDIKCAYCDEIFVATNSLLNHLDRAHDEKTLFKCEKCGRFFSMLLLKEIHMVQQHLNENTEDIKPFVCKTCKKGFGSKISLKSHEEIHSDEKPFLCFECGKRFKTSSSLHTHRICHSEKTMQCPDCPMTFNRIAGFNKHRDVHLNLKYKCNLCHRELKSKDALERHTRRHRLTDDDKKHHCTFCPMKFFKKDKLTRHIRTHTGEKPFKCPFCSDRAYAQKGDLTKHIKQKHTENKIYNCDICDAGFQYYAEMKSHTFEHYKEDKAKQELSQLET